MVASSTKGQAEISVGIQPVTVGFGGGGQSTTAMANDTIVFMKIQEDGWTRIEAGRKMFFPYSKDKETFLTILVRITSV